MTHRRTYLQITIMIGALTIWMPVLCTSAACAAGNGADAAQPNGGPVACVRTVPLQRGAITEHIVVYGSVIAAPGALQTISLSYESQVLKILVNKGQEVSEGDVLLQTQPSPDTQLQLDQAQNAFTLARQSYRQMQRQRNLKLATNEQLLQARQALESARLSLESLQKRGIDGQSDIKAGVGGLVKTIHVQEGSIVPAGSPLMQIVAQNRIEIVLGVETEDIERVHIGQAVALNRVNAPAAPEVGGTVRRISYAVNPSTHLVDVFVTLTSPAGFLLGESIQGKIPITAAQGLIVPRAAVLPEGDRYVLFTVEKGHAVKHVVEIGIETADAYQVIGKALQPGRKGRRVGQLRTQRRHGGDHGGV